MTSTAGNSAATTGAGTGNSGPYNASSTRSATAARSSAVGTPPTDANKQRAQTGSSARLPPLKKVSFTPN